MTASMNRFILPVAAGAGTFVLLAAAAAGGYALHRPDRQTVTVTTTVTRTVPKTVYVTRWKTRTVTSTVSAPDPGAITCIHDLYDQLSADAANDHMLPEGWWLVECEPYVP